MNWPWSKKQQFGDIVDAELDNISIGSRLIFSCGPNEDPMNSSLGFTMPESAIGRKVFVIERDQAGRVDQHLFTVDINTGDIEWWWHRKSLNGCPVLISEVGNQKGMNELTRILARHWNFRNHI